MAAIETRYRVTGMDCAACAAKVETAVSRLEGVERVSVSATAGTMTVGHDEDAVLLPAMKAQLGRLGYGVLPADGAGAAKESAAHSAGPHEHDDHGHDHARSHDHGHDEDGSGMRS